MNIEDILIELKSAVGQRLNLVQARDNTVRLVFDVDVIIISFPDISCVCLDCEEGNEDKRIG